MKIYVITLAVKFQKPHQRTGELTNFKQKFLLGQCCPDCNVQQDLSGKNISQCNGCVRACMMEKIHTIRANYPLWAKRIAEVQEGKAVLSIRQWSGTPYRSKQVEIRRLTAENGVGIQKMELTSDLSECMIEGRNYPYVSIANNDGLSAADWIDWFSTYDLFRPLAVIQFTNFRY